MTEGSRCGDLQQLVQEEENEEPLSRVGQVTPPMTPVRPSRRVKNESHDVHSSQQILCENNMQMSPVMSKTSSGQGTSQGSMISSRVTNPFSYSNSQSRVMYINEKEKLKPNKSESSKPSRLHKVATTPCKHHCFMSEVPDVRRMEQALLQLLEDFHSGNLRAFGKDCTMDQMTEIREQQEKLARLHFELGQLETNANEEPSGFRHSSANMRHLLQRLQQLSVCIEKLHSK